MCVDIPFVFPPSFPIAFEHCFYARGHLSLWVFRSAVYLSRVLLQPVLSSVVVTEWDHELSQRGGKLWGQAGFLCGGVGVCLSTKEFEVSLPPLPAHSFHFPFSKNHPLKENRRRCSAFGLSQQLGAYSRSCKLQFFSPVKPAHTPTYPSTSVYCGDYGGATLNNSVCLEGGGS